MAAKVAKRKLPGLGTFSKDQSQTRRRDQALENQSNRRHALFSLSRQGLDSDLSDLEMEDEGERLPAESDSAKMSLFGTVVEPASTPIKPKSANANKRGRRFGGKLFVNLLVSLSLRNLADAVHFSALQHVCRAVGSQ